jgi:hypothetical protein
MRGVVGQCGQRVGLGGFIPANNASVIGAIQASEAATAGAW